MFSLIIYLSIRIMSPTPLALYHASSPIKSIIHQRNTQIARSSFITTSSTKLNVTRASNQLNQTPNHATRAKSVAVPLPVPVSVLVPIETSMSKLEKKRNQGFWFREWNAMDVTQLSLTIGKLVLAVCAPFVFNWSVFWVAVVLTLFTGMGVNLGYHRLLTHRSFKLPKWLEYFFAYCGVHAGQGMRLVIINQCTYFVNSVCHIWGERAWNTPDTSTNSWWVALLTFGVGWHNNHHAFPSSACHVMEWWQLDLTWELIKFLEMVGLAKDVKLPTEAEKKRMMLCSK